MRAGTCVDALARLANGNFPNGAFKGNQIDNFCSGSTMPILGRIEVQPGQLAA
jgi:hypothetical protein